MPRLIRTPFLRHPPDTDQAFSRWLQSPAGSHLLAAEKQVLDELLPRMTGYRALQCAVGEPVPLLGASRLRNHYVLSRRPGENVQLVGRTDALPVAKSSLDLVVLHHSLDFDDNPHQVLRDAARALVPGGCLVVVGFNPASLTGLARWLYLASSGAPWLARFLPPRRVGDWLNVLACEPEGYESGHFLPLAADATQRRFAWLERLVGRFWSQRGAFYVLVARKRAAMIRPVPSRFARERSPQIIPVPAAQWRRRSQPDPSTE
ncbi:MAG: methyltransferase domain-containing protein [Alcanivoracaceae bacterium]|nr:methyltransferase domain-containing protein [Alcanivoracaceae bacterium]